MAELPADQPQRARSRSEPERLRRVRRPWLAMLLAVLVVGMVAGAFVAGQSMTPPMRETLQQANAPIAVTATVERRTVDSRPTFTGRVVDGATKGVVVRPPADNAIVTRRALRPGATYRAGMLLGAVSGEPYFALRGAVPLYRNLVTGNQGDDVTAFQKALINSGIDVTVNGIVDWQTMAAVEQLYVRNGFRLPRVASDDSGDTEPAAHVSNVADATDNTTKPGDKDTTTEPTPAPTPSKPPEPTIPAYAFVSAPAASAQVVSSAKVGARIGADTPLVTLQTGVDHVVIRAAAADAGSIKVGQKMQVAAGSATFEMKVATIGPFDQGGDGELPGRDVQLVTKDPDFTKVPSGTSVVAHAAGKQVESLAVPLTAVRQDTQGDYVNVPATGPDGAPTTRRVPVTVTSSGDGWAAIEEETLREGDKVLVS